MNQHYFRRSMCFAGSMIAAVVLAVIGTAGSADAAPTVSPAALNGYQLVFVSSGKCADDPGWSTTRGTNLDQWQCVQQSNEAWNFDPVTTDAYGNAVYYVRNAYSGLCMNVQSDSTANGAAVIQWGCSISAHNGLWIFDSTNTIDGHSVTRLRNYHSGKCLNVAGDSLNNGAWLVRYSCGNYDNEWFYTQ